MATCSVHYPDPDGFDPVHREFCSHYLDTHTRSTSVLFMFLRALRRRLLPNVHSVMRSDRVKSIKRRLGCGAPC
jgi:hypothetical protein